MTTLEEIIDGETSDDIESRIEESEEEKAEQEKRDRRKATKYGSMLNDDE